MPDALIQPCAAVESPASRAMRLGSLTLLLAIAFVESGVAGLMYAETQSVANFAFLFFALGLFAAVVIHLRSPDPRVLLVVQSAAAAALLSLFWAGQSGVAHGPSLRLGNTTYELTLTLAALLFVALLLGRLLRRSPAEQDCHCG